MSKGKLALQRLIAGASESAWAYTDAQGHITSVNWFKVEAIAEGIQIKSDREVGAYIKGLSEARDFLLTSAMVCPQCLGGGGACSTCLDSGFIMYAPGGGTRHD